VLKYLLADLKELTRKH